MLTSLVWALAVIQIQGFVYSLYVHRYKCHQSITLHPIFEQLCLLLIWLTSTQLSSAWWIRKSVARHLKHHQYTDQKQDPHSPLFFKLIEIIRWNKSNTPGGCYYVSDEDIKHYGRHVPLETSLIAKYIFFKLPSYSGMIISSIIILILVDSYVIFPLLAIWGLPITSGILTIYFPHVFGYQNYKNNNSKNSWPLAIFQWGEELHNNHHKTPSKANFSHKWWEIDLGYVVIKLLSLLKLVNIR